MTPVLLKYLTVEPPQDPMVSIESFGATEFVSLAILSGKRQYIRYNVTNPYRNNIPILHIRNLMTI